MKEMEVEVKFDNTEEEAIRVLSKYEYIGEKEIWDTYYYDPTRKELQPESDLRLNETFRIRRIGDKCHITYKKQHFKGKLWVYSDEYETEVKDFKTMEKIVNMLGLKELIKVHNKRKIYKTKEYEIELENVEGLGLFLEVERISPQEEDGMLVKEQIRDFIRNLGLKNVRELNIGKNQYLLSQKLNHPLHVFNDTKYE